jgi:hypothetical protein
MRHPDGPEILACLKTMREVCAAGFRIAADHGLGECLGDELMSLGIEAGFGVRCQDLIARLEAEK